MVPTFKLFRQFYSLKQRKNWYFLQSRGKPLVTHLPDSHKGWKGKLIRLKFLGGFGVPLKWELADRSLNRFFEATKVKHDFFNKVWAMFFLGMLVKD